MEGPKVLIISASETNLPIFNEAVLVLNKFGVDYDITISSAHRSPERTIKLVTDAYNRGVKVIIAGASLAAHLAGVAAAHFPLPVIGVPLSGGTLSGEDSLFATVQMPHGVPVATVAVDGGKNAGLLAVQILATSDKELEEKMIEFKKELAQSIENKAKNLEEKGLEKILKEKV